MIPLLSCIHCNGRVTPPFSWTRALTFSLFSNDPLLPTDHWLCTGCLEQLATLNQGCELCSRKYEEQEKQYFKQIGRKLICYDCERWNGWEESKGMGRILERNTSAILYNDWAKEMISQYKFRRDERLKYFFSALMVEAWEGRVDMSTAPIDLITSVPISQSRLIERGFNQTSLIASLISVKLGTPFYSDILMWQHEDGKQSKKNRSDRLEELLQKFIKHPDTMVDINNKSILVIDDIYTTGATMRAIAYTLICLGAKKVTSLTIAR
jgi:competence protein ComFC